MVYLKYNKTEGMVINMKQVDSNVKFKNDLSNAEVEGVGKLIKEFASASGNIWGSYHAPVGKSISSYAMVVYENLHICYDDEDMNVKHVAITTEDVSVLVCCDEEGSEIIIELEKSDLF